MTDRLTIDRALNNGRVAIRIGDIWWKAQRRSRTRTTGTHWFIVVGAGPDDIKRIISNQNDNVEFKID